MVKSLGGFHTFLLVLVIQKMTCIFIEVILTLDGTFTIPFRGHSSIIQDLVMWVERIVGKSRRGQNQFLGKHLDNVLKF